ncbi:MAG TPA: amino acid adenylation domain-containing protein [Planctomycetota bacterium]|nr:amino acid adenylation domain-containing protein [Planctomycetota bacterium]
MEIAPTDLALVHEAVFETARHRPEGIATLSVERSQTYAELERSARDVAAALAALGAGPERIVAVCIERSVEIGAAVLGVLASGAAYLPIDPSTPPARLRELIADSGAILVLTSKRLAAHCAAGGVPVIAVDDLPAERAVAKRPSLENLAYVLYTSGSTGRPKGVMVEHRSLAVHARGMASHFGLEPADRVLQFASLAFDVAAEELFPTWLAGATVCLRDEAIANSFAAFTKFLAEKKISVANLPAGFWQEWTSELARTATGLDPSLRLVIAGSERASPASLAQWKSRFGERPRWMNGYGPTETTITATTFEPSSDGFDPRAASVPIGLPLPWVELHVLDAELREVEDGMPGELAIAGAGVARGYLGAPELSAAKFVRDPFSTQAGARMYLSGDRVRRRSDGVVEFLGREDDQVKLRGYRIELGEIESALEKLPGVAAAAVLLREDTPGVRNLVGYVSPVDGAAIDVDVLRNALSKTLSEYMVPAEILVLAQWPRTAGGKLDRKSLPAPLRRASGEPPRGKTEVLLATLWCELLGLAAVGRDDHFFRLGGHSLLAMQLAGRLAERAKLELTPRLVFEHPTLSALAAAIDAGPGNPWPTYPPMRRVDRSLPIPLSASQEPVWFLLQLEPGLLAYNTQFSVRFAGAIDPLALRRALALLVERHEILRTTFHAVGDTPRQTIHPAWQPPMELIDLSLEPAAIRQARAETICAKLCVRRFDVGELPLVEWTLLKHAPDDWELVQVEHHFVHDGWSIMLLMRDLAKLYGDCAAGRAPSLPAQQFQFADYVTWQREMLSGPRRERLVGFWRERLRGAPALLTLPTDRQRPALQTFNGASEVLTIPPVLFKSLAGLARREGFTPFQLLLTAFEIVLSRHSGQSDIVIATAAANRRTLEVEGILGMLVNPVPIRVDTSGDISLRELATRVRASALESFEHQDLPFESVVQAVEPPRDFSHNPIFQVLFSFHDSAVPDLAMGSARGRMVYRYNGSAKFDMNLVVIPRSEQRVGRAESDEDGDAIIEWEYNTDLFDRARVVRMVGHLRRLLEGLEAGFDAKCAALEMLSKEELAEVAAFNATDAPFPRELGLVDLFREQAGLAPDAIAVSFGTSRVSYRELSERVDRLAAHLASKGVAHGDLVGVCVERSLPMLVSLLAISACGGAYLPLDPALPPDRLDYILGDAFSATARPWVISQASLSERLPKRLGEGLIDIDIALAAPASPLARENPRPARGGDRAYVIYTSGSTGKPKGVEVTQSNLVNFLTSMRKRLPLARGDVLLAITTLSFDIAGLELFLPLCCGAAVAIATREEASDAQNLSVVLAREKATCLQATPATWRMLVEAGWQPQSPLTALCGGEALPLELAREIAARTRKLFNLYGPTETTIWSSIDSVEPEAREVTIGRPLDNTRLYVLGPQRELLPQGASGELWISGAGVARGYHGRAELTAERFLPDPFASSAARMYRTGDLARRRADGRIEYQGRLDQQIKLRGFRIELGEIEAALRAHPAVLDAAVDLRELGAGDQRLVAWYVAADPTAQGEIELRDFLARQLPEYMVPSAFARLEALPRTHNGKLDRAGLPAAAGIARHGDFSAPAGELELGVAEIWREVLALEQVGARDRFFDLGGHSLLAMRAITRMEARFGVRVPARDLMLQNLAQLASAIAERQAKTDKSRRPLEPAAPDAKKSNGLLGALRGFLGKPPRPD